MAIDEIKPLEAVSHQRPDQIAKHRDQGARPQRDRPGEAQMMLGHANRDRRGDEGARGLTQAFGDDLGANRIGPDQAGGPMLLGRAYRQNDAAARSEIRLDLHPGLQLQLHSSAFHTIFACRYVR